MLAAQAAQIGAVVLFAPLTVHALGTERVGALSLVWALVAYFSILDLGLGRAVTQAVSGAIATGERGRVVSLFWSATLTQLGLGALAATALVFCAPILLAYMRIPAPLYNDVLTSVKLCALSIPLVFVSGSLTGLFQAANRFDITAAITIPSAIAIQGIPWLVALYWPSLTPIAGAVLVIRTASAVAAMIVAACVFHGLFRVRSANLGEWRRLLSFGGWVTVSNVLTPLLSYLDRFLIGAFLPLSYVAYYSIPYDAIMRVNVLPNSINVAAFPTLSRLIAARDDARARTTLAQTVNVLTCSMVVPVVAICGFGKDLLSVWLGADFAVNGSLVLQILTCGVYINAFATVPYTMLQAAGRPDVTAKLHLAELLPHIAVLSVLVHHWGIIGAAIAWSLRVTVDAALVWGAALRLIGGVAASDVKREVQNVACGLFGAGVLAVLVDNIPWIAGRLGATLAAISLAAWLISWRSLSRENQIRVAALTLRLKGMTT